MGDNKQLADISSSLKKLTEGQKTLKAELVKKIEESKEETIKSLTDKIDKLSRKNERVTSRVDNLEIKVDDIIDSNSRLCNLIISGIPAKDNENLSNIFRSIASKLGFESSPDARLFRFKGNNPMRSIVARFPSEFHKDEFMFRYIKAASSLHFDTVTNSRKDNKTRIYLQHDLSQAEYKKHKAAIKLRNSGDIKAIRIIRGHVGVKFDGDEKFSFFPNAEALEKAANDHDAD